VEGDGLEESLTGCHVTDLGLLHVAWGLSLLIFTTRGMVAPMHLLRLQSKCVPLLSFSQIELNLQLSKFNKSERRL
jgi:hypothetical protein